MGKCFNIDRYLIIATMLSSIILFASCERLVDVDAPTTSSNADIVYSSDATAISALTGIYTKISQNGIRSGILSLSLFPGLSSDELALFSGINDVTYLAYFRNALTGINTQSTDFWMNIYPIIFSSNLAIEGLTSSTLLTPSVKQILLGEAKFIRAFCYFYLVNLYGDVPLALTTDYKINSNISRASSDLIYRQIINDLLDAQGLLSDEYLDASLRPTHDRVRPNKWAATAMLARTYLYLGDFKEAELQANIVINNYIKFDTVPLQSVFLKNSKETIWAIQPVDNFVTNTPEARLFILPSAGPNEYLNQVYLSQSFLEKFELGDNRRMQWTDKVSASNTEYYFSSKYKNNEPFSPVTEYTIALRLCEQYLIRAEARSKQANLNGALNDLNIVRRRANLNPIFTTSQAFLDIAIINERRSEFFCEFGHRWFDLKRWGKAKDILRVEKGNNWQETDALYPIPQSDIERNPALRGHQNPGY